MKNFNILLFDNFETLDAFGSAEIIGKLSEQYYLEFFSVSGGIITSSQNIKVFTLPINDMKSSGIFLIPGGMGTRNLINDTEFIRQISSISYEAEYVLTICTGAALLAKTEFMNVKSATTNKIAFDWVCSLNNKVNWIRKARWIQDGNLYSSSGVSAGIDMTLAFIAERNGVAEAENIASSIEYVWNRDKESDPFA